MRVLVTGGAGFIGKAVTERLLNHGWEVRSIDIAPSLDLKGVEYTQCDIRNYAEVREQVRDCQCIVHMGAIPRPQLGTGPDIFSINAAGTFNIFEAASAEGIKRVVQASSINAIGGVYNLTDLHTEYFPIDEQHPPFNTDPYSFSKQVIEDIGRYYWRRDGISSVALRFSGVNRKDTRETPEFQERRQNSWHAIDDFAKLSDEERRERLAAIRKRTIEFRQTRSMEFKTEPVIYPQRKDVDDQLWYIYAFDRFNFWAFVDERDAAQSIEKGLTAEYEGSHPLFIMNQRNWMGYDAHELVRLFFPEIPEEKNKLSGPSSLISIEQARQLIGFDPEYTVEAR
jgi:hypothetical protein